MPPMEVKKEMNSATRGGSSTGVFTPETGKKKVRESTSEGMRHYSTAPFPGSGEAASSEGLLCRLPFFAFPARIFYNKGS